MNVLVVCASGMTSSVICEKIRKQLKDEHIEDVKVGSCGISQIHKYAIQADVVLIAPQIEYLKKEIDDMGYTKCKMLPKDIYSKEDVHEVIDSILHPDEEQKITKENKLMKFNKIIGELTENKWMSSIYSGISATLPISVIGAIFTIIRSFPIESYVAFIESIGIGTLLDYAITMTLGMISLYIVLLTSKAYAERCNQSAPNVMISSVVSFFLITESIQNGNVDLTYFGVRGIFTALIVSLVTSGFVVFIKEKMRYFGVENLRRDIQDSLVSVFPVLLTCVLSVLFMLCIHALVGMSFPSYVVLCLQKYVDPYVGSNIWASVYIQAFAHVLWFFGIHGGKVIGVLKDPIYTQYSYANLAAYHLGQELPYVVTSTTAQMYTFGGAGSTLSLVILMCFFAKSQKLKNLGKLSLPMGIFFINEPILFGLPYVLNPFMLLPIIGIPFISGSLTVFLMSIGFLPKCIGVEIPWTTPPILSGLLEGGWKLALWQGVLLVLQGLIWYPVFRLLDKKELEKESA